MNLLKKIRNNFLHLFYCYMLSSAVIINISACSSCRNTKDFPKESKYPTNETPTEDKQPGHRAKFKLAPATGVDITNLKGLTDDGSVEISLVFTNNTNAPLNQETLKKIQIVLGGTTFDKVEYADSYQKLSNSQKVPHYYKKINNFSTTLWEVFEPFNITAIDPGATVNFHLWLFPKSTNKRVEASIKLIEGMDLTQLNDKSLNNALTIIWNPDIALKILDEDEHGEELSDIRGLDPHNPGARTISILFENESSLPLDMSSLQDLHIEFSNNNITEILYTIQQRGSDYLVKPISNQPVSLAELLKVFSPQGIFGEDIGKVLFFIRPADTKREASFTMQIKDKSNNLIDNKRVVWNP